MKKKLSMIILFIVTILPVMTVNASTKYTCGGIDNIPAKIPQLTSMAVTIIQIAVPILLVVLGSLDLMKSVAAQKEDEIKKGQKVFIRRLAVAAVIFFVIAIVKLLVSLVADSSDVNNITECMDCFLSNDCETQPLYDCPDPEVVKNALDNGYDHPWYYYFCPTS